MFFKEADVLGENLLQRLSGLHRCHMICPGLEPVPPRWKAGD
jgi:hypothetical protein